MEVVRQRKAILVRRAVERQPVDVPQVRVAASLDHLGEHLAHHLQGERPAGHLLGIAAGDERDPALGEGLRVGGRRTRHGLVDGAVHGRDQPDRGVGVAVADGVEPAVDRRRQRAAPQQVLVDQVDAELEADEVGRGVADRARDEGVEEGAAAEAEVDQVETGQAGRHHGPRLGGVGRDRAVADRAAVVDPPRPVVIDRGHRCVGAQVHERGLLVVRQPDLDVLDALRERDHEGRRLAGGEGARPRHHVDVEHVAAGCLQPLDQHAVDEHVVPPVRPRRCADIAPLGGQHVELEAGGGGAQREAYAGGLGLDEVELRVVGLGPRPRGQAVGQQAAVGALELERTLHEGLEQGRVGHRVSQERSRVSSPSSTRSHVSSGVGAPGAPWLKAPAASSAA